MPDDEVVGSRDPRRGTPGWWVEAGVVNAITEEGHGFDFWQAPGLTRSERRRARHYDVIRWALNEGMMEWAWTPAERQAIEMFYQVGITPARAARMLRITRQQFGKRLTRAEDAAQRWYDGDEPRNREKRGRPDARLTVDGTEEVEVGEMNPVGLSRRITADPLEPDRVADYLLPLIKRQRRLERSVERLSA